MPTEISARLDVSTPEGCLKAGFTEPWELRDLLSLLDLAC